MAPEKLNTPSLASRIEAFLFSEGGTLSKKKLCQLLGIKDAQLAEGLKTLDEVLKNRGITLIISDTEATLALQPETSQEVKDAYQRELGREIGDAGLEVLSIVLYRGPSTRAQIDYIRGVNTSSTMRTLMARGLIERAENPEDAREYLYRPTVELLSHLGVRRAEELPDYDKISSELKSFEQDTGPFAHGDTADNTQHDASQKGASESQS